MTIDQMAEFVDAHQTGPLFRLYGKRSTHPAIKDIELQRIDSLIDDRIVNKILAPDGYPSVICFRAICFEPRY